MKIDVTSGSFKKPFIGKPLLKRLKSFAVKNPVVTVGLFVVSLTAVGLILFMATPNLANFVLGRADKAGTSKESRTDSKAENVADDGTIGNSQANDDATAVSSGQTPGTGNNGSSPTSPSPSSSPPTPTSPGQSASTFNAPIGFVGCSNIRDTVQGYIANGGTKFWVPAQNTYGGGTVTRWNRATTDYWSEFDALLAQYPSTKTIWWGMCTYTADRESDVSNQAAADAIVSGLRSRIPGVTIYVSAMNSFVAPHVCALTGEDGISRMQNLANTTVSQHGLKAGPLLGSLISKYQTPSSGANDSNNQTATDGCHPNAAGEAHIGQSLNNFFGN